MQDQNVEATSIGRVGFWLALAPWLTFLLLFVLRPG